MGQKEKDTIHVGVYQEDDPYTMKIVAFIQAEDGETLLNGGDAVQNNYVTLGRIAGKRLKSRRCLELVVVHPGVTHDENNPGYPIGNSSELGQIARGIASEGYETRIDVADLHLPARGSYVGSS